MLTKGERGFTIVEVVISLMLVGVGGLALMATNDYFSKSLNILTTRAEHTKMRNLIRLALAQKKLLAGGGIITNNCKVNLKARDGTSSLIPGYDPLNHTPITKANSVELQIDNDGGIVVRSNDDRPNRPKENLDYTVYLIGKYRATSRTTGNNLYVGEVLLEGKRVNAGAHVEPIVGTVPIEFELAGAGDLVDCTTKTREPELANGRFTLSECQLAGGSPISTAAGIFCRFRQLTLALPSLPCPDGFLPGDPLVGCTVDLTTPTTVTMVPNCPAPYSKADAATIALLPPLTVKGHFYCMHSVPKPVAPAVLPTPAVCPDDPDWIATDYPVGTTPLGWVELAAPDPVGYVTTATDNIRVCKYNGKCGAPDPGTVVVPTVAPGDGETPGCQFAAPTVCPNFPEWSQIGSAPLKCKYTPGTVASTTLGCPQGFTALSPSIPGHYQVITDWVDGTHVMCY